MNSMLVKAHRIAGLLHGFSRPAFVLATLMIAGCALAKVPEEGDAILPNPSLLHESALSPNALSPNALSPNALSADALRPIGLAAHALSPDALGADALVPLGDAHTVGTLARSLLAFTVGCALTPAQSFALSWTDDQSTLHTVTYRGMLGLAPSWADGPLDVAGQRWVSACLAARTNRYGATVMLSLRGAHDTLASTEPAELAAYPHLEGAFWGNIFSATPALYACFTEANIANSRAHLRDCAAGKQEGTAAAVTPCGHIAILGPCASACAELDVDGGYYEGCDDPAVPSGSPMEAITSALP
jgi:hypothetical protein